MKTKSALDVTYKDWIKYPDSAGLEAAFLSNESSSGIAIWYQLSDVTPTDNDGHTLGNADWIAFDTKDGSSLWLKAKRNILDHETCRVRLSA